MPWRDAWRALARNPVEAHHHIMIEFMEVREFRSDPVVVGSAWMEGGEIKLDGQQGVREMLLQARLNTGREILSMADGERFLDVLPVFYTGSRFWARVAEPRGAV